MQDQNTPARRLAMRQTWVGAACLLACFGADAWAALFKPSEFLSSMSFTLLVMLILFFCPPRFARLR